MANPQTRQEFGQYCLRALGAPVLEINVSEEQVDDRIDFCSQDMVDYHFDGSEKCYYKYVMQEKDKPGHVSEVEVVKGGIGYSNTDAVVFTANVAGADAAASITTNANGTILTVNVSNIGTGYLNPPVVSVTSANGTGARLEGYNGGYITIPDNIIGAVNIFDISSSFMGGAASMFNIQYQIALNDMYNLTSVSMVPYFMARTQIAEIAQWMIGKQPIRYNRHRNRMYIDMDWQRTDLGGILIVEAYQVVDPDAFKDAWNDRWLLQYATAQIKRQWGNNLKKYDAMLMPGGTKFNGQIIHDEAVAEIKELEQRMIMDYGYPVYDMIG